jgi:valyl-tRNA synthetase
MIGAYILAEDGTPMHASKGNAVDPIEILEEFGSDAMRYYAASCALGMDNPFRMKDIKRGVRLCTKLWNMQNFIGKAIEGKSEFDSSNLSTVDKWILSRYTDVLNKVTDLLDEYQFDRSMKAIENFLWHEFADHYIEMVKNRIYEKKDEGALFTLSTIGLGLTKMLATFLPHITEEIYQTFYKELDGSLSLHISSWPEPVLTDEVAQGRGELAKNIIAELRNWKSDQRLPLNAEISLVEIVAGDKTNLFSDIKEDISNTVRAKELNVVDHVEVTETPTAVIPVYAKLGPKFKEKAAEIGNILKSADPKEVSDALGKGEYEIILKSGDKVGITNDFVEIESAKSVHGREMTTLTVDEFTILVGK